MRKAACTPGPWATYRLAPDSDVRERLIVVAEDGETEICGAVENEADAHLIAAAPALFGAALLVIDHWNSGDLAEAVRTLGAAVTEAKKRHIMIDEATPFIDYWDAVDDAMLKFFGIDTDDAGIDADLIASAQEECQTPEDFARRFGEKYDLAYIAEA